MLHKLKFHNLLLLLVLNSILCDDKFLENTAKICENKCKCSTENGQFLIACQDVHGTLANWPEQVNENHTGIEATFSGNSIKRLESMPGTNLTLALVYDHCNITELGTGLFESAVNVTYLDLSYNLLEARELHSDVFKGPYSNSSFEPIALQHLNLAYNRIHSLPLNLFEHMLGLKYLNLEGNHFRVIDSVTAASIATLTKLEYFNIAKNNLVHIREDMLAPMKSLNVLVISQNQFDLVPLAILEVGKTLRELYMDDCTILEIEDKTFLGMTELTELSARNMKSLVDIKTNAFASLENLRRIDLSGLNGSRIKIDDQAFGGIAKLEELNLSGSDLTSLPKNLINWSELRSLDLRKNQFFCECYWLNITGSLREEIKVERDGPRCYDMKRHRSYEIYRLTEDVCYKTKKYSDLDISSRNSRTIRITLLLVSVLMLMILAFFLWLKFGKRFAKMRGNRSQQFASSVIYNPIAANTNF